MVLKGEGSRGTIYAVYQFLEDFMGFRWFTPEDEYISTKSTQINVNYSPPFQYRSEFGAYSMLQPEFSSLLRQNGEHNRLEEMHGGSIQILGFVHTFAQYIPLEKYFQTNPEWFVNTQTLKPAKQDDILGDNQATQLCLTNQNLIAEFEKNVLLKISQNPQAKIVSISQNDNGIYCNCDQCRTIINDEKTSGYILKFVNTIAEKVKAKYPKIIVETLMYAGGVEPPTNIRPSSNVLIRLSLINHDIGFPITNSINSDKKILIDKWSSISPKFYYWDYVENINKEAAILPVPVFARVGEDLKYLSKKAQGYFVETTAIMQKQGYLTEMRSWVLSKLMWNPNLSQEILIEEFMRYYYGDSYQEILGVYNSVENSFSNRREKLASFFGDYGYLTSEVLYNAQNNLDKARLKSSKNPEILKRIQKVQLSFDNAFLFQYQQNLLANKNKSFFNFNYDQKKNEFKKNIENFNFDKSLILKKIERVETNRISDDKVVISQDNFQLYEQGKFTGIVDDPTASDGKSAFIKGISSDWAVIVWPTEFIDFFKNKKVLITANIKIIMFEKREDANVHMGVYNIYSKKNKALFYDKAINYLKKQYIPLNLQLDNLEKGDEIYIYISKDCQCIDKILIDNIEIKAI